jgi:hypothetical protein
MLSQASYSGDADDSIVLRSIPLEKKSSAPIRTRALVFLFDALMNA